MVRTQRISNNEIESQKQIIRTDFEMLKKTRRCNAFLGATDWETWSADPNSGKQSAVQNVYRSAKAHTNMPSKSATKNRRVKLKSAMR